MNKRADNRYFTKAIPLENIGDIVEVSRNGLKIRKKTADEVEGGHEAEGDDQWLVVPLAGRDIKARIIWQDRSHMGLSMEKSLDDLEFIKKNIRTLKQGDFPPQIMAPEDSFLTYRKEDLLCTLINFLVELDSPHTDMYKLKAYIDEISGLYGETEHEEVAETPTPEAADLKAELISRAAGGDVEGGGESMNVDFAISRLGLENVKKITGYFVRKKISQSSAAMAGFQNYEAYSTLKSVFFGKLSPVLNFHDTEGDGNALLSFETAGVEVLINRSSMILDEYYSSSSRIYSEISRRYEKALFGKDMLEVNEHYFKSSAGRFKDLYDGYVLAHQVLNPHYLLPGDIKLSLNKTVLNYSFVVYLTFLAINFVMDKDKECGNVLVNKLMGKGLKGSKALDLINDCVSEANNVLRDFGMHGMLKPASLPSQPLRMDRFLPKGIHCKYVIHAFREFEKMSPRRMALCYEDRTYAHFVLNKFINDPDCALNRKTSCVVPCGNLTHDPLYPDDFSNFDLLIFKDINKLPPPHIKDFVRIWGGFEGAVIVTFSKQSFLDHTLKALYALIKDAIVDFPSYFSDTVIYERMIEHTLGALRPYLGEEVEKDKYLDDVYTMDHIRADMFMSKEII